MRTEDSARIARLEQLLDEQQEEIAQLKDDLEGLRSALQHVVGEAFGVLEAVDRQTEAGKQRLERMLGRPFNNTKLIDQLTGRAR